MILVPMGSKRILPRVTALMIGLCIMLCATAVAQKKPEHFWLAGRYGGNRVLVYFDAVQFEGTMSSNSRKLTPPVADGFF